MKTNPWHYSGDIGIRHGGFYWRIPSSGFIDYVEAVEVSPTEDDTIFTVNDDLIYMPDDPKKVRSALECCGYELTSLGHIKDYTGSIITDTMPLLVDAYKAYWGMNDYHPTIVQIGGPRNTNAYHFRLAHNASLRKFVEKEFLHD